MGKDRRYGKNIEQAVANVEQKNKEQGNLEVAKRGVAITAIMNYELLIIINRVEDCVSKIIVV